MALIPKLEKQQRIDKLMEQTTQPGFSNSKPLNPDYKAPTTNIDKEARITALMDKNMGAVSPIVPKVEQQTKNTQTSNSDIELGKLLVDRDRNFDKYHSVTDDNYKQMLSKEDAIKYQKEGAELSRAGAFGSKHPVLGTVLSLASTPFVAVEGVMDNILGLVTGDESFSNKTGSLAEKREQLREGVKANMYNGQGAYDMATGIGDMLVNTATAAATGGGTVAAGALMGGNRANVVQKEASERGLDTRKASALGTIAGGAEGYFNTLGLDKLKEGAGILKGAGIEGLENIAQSGVEDIADTVISGKNSEINNIKQSYINQGMSEEEANRRTIGDVAKQYGMEFGTGAAFGALMGAGRNVSDKLRSHIVNQDGNGRSMSDIIESLADEDVADDIADNVVDNADNAIRDNIEEVIDNIDNIRNDTNVDVLDNGVQDTEGRIDNILNNLENQKTKPTENITENTEIPNNEAQAKIQQGFSEGYANKKANIPQTFQNKIDSDANDFRKIANAVKFDNPQDKAAAKEGIKKLYEKTKEFKYCQNMQDITAWEKEVAPIFNETMDILKRGKLEYADNSAKIANKQLKDDFYRMTQGTVIQIPANLRSEFTDMKMKDFNDLSFRLFGKDSKKLRFVTKAQGEAPDTFMNEYRDFFEALGIYDDNPAIALGNLKDYMQNLATQGKGKAPIITENVTDDLFDDYWASMSDNSVLVFPIYDVEGDINSRNFNEALDVIKNKKPNLYEQAQAEINNPINPSGVETSINRLNSPNTDIEANAGKNIPLNNESVLNDTNRPITDNAVNNAEPNRNIAQNADDGSATFTFDMPKAENTDIPQAENATRDINQRPFVNENTNSPDMAERRTVTNTAKNNSLLDNLKEDEIKQLKEYERIHESTSLSDAEERVKDTNSRLRWESDFVNGNRKFQSSTDTDTGMLLLTDIEKQIRNTDEADVEAINNLTARKQKLLSNMAEQMTEKGQAIQALAKWNRTSDGAILNGEILAEKEVKKWANKGKNTKDVDFNKKIAGALSMLNPKNAAKETAEQAENTIEGIKNALDKGGVLNNFNEDAINQLKGLIDSGVSGEELADEIQHYIRHGEFYTIGEEIPFKEPTNQKLKNAITNMFKTDIVKEPKKTMSFDEIRASVRNTIDNESSASISKNYTDADIDYLAGMIQNGATTKELTDLLNRKAVIGNFGISNQTQKEVAEIFDSISHLDPNSKDYVEMATEAYRKIAFESLPNATFGEKFDAWRYLAMLGNPKTITRNVLGNKMNAVTTGFSNNLAAAMEIGADKLSKNGIERTKAFINPIADKPLLDLAKQDADNFRYADLSGSRFSKRSVQDDIIRNRQIWEKGGIVDKWQNATDRFLTDYPAAKNKYSTSLVGYMKANKLDEDAFMKEALYKNLKAESKIRVLSPEERLQMNEYKSVADLMEKARDYATKEAKYATFHEDSVIADKISRTISDWKNTDAEGTQGTLVRTAGRIAEGNIPFVSTPINITKVGIQYSPLNAISSISKTGKMILKKGVEPADVISSWSKTLTGSAMFLMGKYLYDRGVLLSSDNETAWQDTLEGKQNYSIKFTKPNGGEATYTVDWLAPGIMPMILGTEYAKMMTDKGEDDTTFIESIKNKDFENAIETAANSALNIASPIMENSMLNGLNDTLKTAANAAQNKEQAGAMLGEAALNSLVSYGTQGVPTIAGQFARTIDNTRRSTYTEKQGIVGVLDKQLQKQENKLPFLSMFNNPYVDTYGRQQNNGIVNTDNPLVNFLPNLAYQMFSPGYFQNVKQTDVDKEAWRLYEGNNDPSVFPNTGTQAKIGGKKMDKDASYLYNTTAGTALSEMGEALVNSEYFKGLSDEDKAEALTDMYQTARATGNVKVGADTKPSENQSKLVNVYNTRGGQGYVNKVKADAKEKEQKEIKKAENKKYESYGVTKTEKTEAVMADKGEAGLKFIGDMKKAIKDEHGKIGAVKAYEYLSSQNLSDYDKGYYIVQTASSLPKLVKQMAAKKDYASVNEYYYLKDTFDTDGNGKLKKSEKDAMIPSLKKMGYSDSDMQRVAGYFD